MNKILALIHFCLAAGLPNAIGQLQQNDTSFFTSSINNAVSFYYRTVAENAGLYSGSEYTMSELFSPEDNKNVFFLSVYQQNGSVLYKGILYQNIPLCFDIYHEDLVTIRYSQNFRIRLNTDKVGSFDFAGHHFVSLRADSANNMPYGPGYYDMLFAGKTLVMAKRRKIKLEKINTLGNTTIYQQNDHVFIVKDGVWFPVKSKRSVINAFGEGKKEMRKYIRKENVSFSSSFEAAVVNAAAHYDQIKN